MKALSLLVVAALAMLLWFVWSHDDARPPSGSAETVAPSGSSETTEPTASVAPPAVASSAAATDLDPLARSAAPVDTTDQGSIHGSVVDGLGAPIAGASVRVYSALDAQMVTGMPTPLPELSASVLTANPGVPPPLAEATTNADGVFRIPITGSWPKPVSAVADANGYETLAHERVTAAAPITFRMTRVLFVQGRVVAGDSGLPMAGAMVRSNAVGVATDADGRYRVRATPQRSRATLHVSRPGYVARDEFVPVGSGEVTQHDVVLQRGQLLRVEVVDASDGRPIAGAAVRLEHREAVHGHSDPAGRFVIDVADGMGLNVVVTAEGRAATTWSWTVRDAASVQPRIPLVPLATISGEVIDTDRAPIVDAEVRAVREGFRGDGIETPPAAAGTPGSFRVDTDGGAVRSNANGRFVLRLAAAGIPMIVMAQHADHVPGRSAPIVLERGGATALVTLQLARGATIRGKVRHNGKPWRGMVSWDPVGSQIPGGRTVLRNDDDYVLSGIPAGEVDVALRGLATADGKRARITVSAGADIRHDFVWDDVVTPIAGRVTSSTGQPLDGIPLHARPARDGTVPLSFTARTDAERRYSLPCTQPGVYVVTATRDTVRRQRDGIAAGATGVDFVLPELGLLRLHLVDAATKQPIRDASTNLGQRPQLAWRENDREPFAQLRDRIDGDGRVAVRLPIGTVDLSLWLGDAGYVSRRLLQVPVTTSSDPEPIVVEVVRATHVELELDPATPMPPDIARQHLLFVVDDRQSALLRGPFAAQSGESNHCIQDIWMWLGEPGLIHNLVDFAHAAHGKPKVNGLAPGVHHLRAFPDDLVFEPLAFDVPAAGAKVVVRWRRH